MDTPSQPQATPLQTAWAWYVSLGVLFLLLGLVGLSMVFALTELCVFIAGYLLVIGGVAQVVSGFFTRPIGSALLHFAAGALYVLAGAFVISHPELAAGIYTLIIAISLVVTGAARIVLAFVYRRYISWLGLLFGGVITLLLGIYIFQLWPWSSAWVIGLFFAIDLMSQGISWLLYGIHLRWIASL